MASINECVNRVVDYMFDNHYQRNYLQGVRSLEELAAARDPLSRFADEALMNLKDLRDREAALLILSRITIWRKPVQPNKEK